MVTARGTLSTVARPGTHQPHAIDENLAVGRCNRDGSAPPKYPL